jgi:uncharacterized protein YutE (UPF0331/DUF86 family)
MVVLMKQSPMFKHAVESFEHGLEHYLDGSDRSRKFAFLHVDQAIELFLKEKAIQIGKSIYKSDGSTLNIHETFKSLKDIDIPEQPRLEELHDLRNTIQHKGLNPDAESTRYYIEIAYHFVKRFLQDELIISIDDILSSKHIALMEGYPLKETIEAAETFNLAQIAETPTAKIIIGFTALDKASKMLSDSKLGKVGIRLTLRKTATEFGVSKEKINTYLKAVFDIRNKVVHSQYEPTKKDAEIFLSNVKKY